MTRPAALRTLLVPLEFAAFVAFVVLAVVFGVSTLLADGLAPLADAGGGGLAAAAAAYLASHVLRWIRLYVILLDFERSPWRVAQLYGALALVGRMIPLKLGELFRFLELSRTVGNFRTAVVAIAIERYFDALTLLWLLLYAFIFDPLIPTDTAMLLIVLSVVAILGSLAYRGLSGFARYLRFLAATRSRSRKGISALRLAASLDAVAEDVGRILRGRAVILAVLSLAVWALEVVTMWLVLAAFAGAAPAGFLGNLLRGLNALLVADEATALVTVGTYFALTWLVIAVFALPLAMAHAVGRLGGFRRAIRMARRTRGDYVRSQASASRPTAAT